jgi:hypothetical protein
MCGSRVNAEAARCPQCGADHHLEPDTALAELEARGGAAPVLLPALPPMPKPGWRWTWRIGATLPALIVPVWVIVWGIQDFINEAHQYYQLPVEERQAGGDPFPPDAGMYFAGAAIFAGLVLGLISASVSLPRRLWLWWGLVVSVFALCLVRLTGIPIGLSHLYLPLLVALRVWWQERAQHSRRP